MVDAVDLTFVKSGGGSETIRAEIGANLLQVTQAAGLEVEGACEGNMACATCHMIFAPENFQSFAPISDEEAEMLDLAIGLQPTSRLGCQVIVTAEMQGWRIVLAEESGALGF